jgi:hypothetical protein
MPTLTAPAEAPGTLEFDVETLELFRGTWQTSRRTGPMLPRAEETIACETGVDCTETDECETVGICSIEDCTGCNNSCSCIA